MVDLASLSAALLTDSLLAEGERFSVKIAHKGK